MVSKTVPVDERLGEMLNYAVRYAIGRRTYAPHDVVQYVEPLVPDLDKVTLRVMQYDIAAEQVKPGGLGNGSRRLDNQEHICCMRHSCATGCYTIRHSHAYR